jgi:transposase
MTAPMLLDGAMDGAAFLAYLEQVLVPTLRPGGYRRDGKPARPQASRGPHRRRAGWAELRYLPPYSPDLNPIEMAFAKLKALLNKAAARTLEDLWRALAAALPRITQSECRNYLTAAGYASRSWAPSVSFVIVRRSREGVRTIAAREDTELMPGDLVRVSSAFGLSAQ